MKIAIQHEFLNVDSDGHVTGHEAGDTLVRRLLRVFPGAQLVGPRTHRYADFDMVPLGMIDAENTVLINMDVVNSVEAHRALLATCPKPKIMNFVWWNEDRFTDDVEVAQIALSCALFPTFTNSDRTTSGIGALVKNLTVQQLSEQAHITGVNLGIRMEHVQPREETDVPVVLYPAIYVTERKQPDMFIDIVERVAKRTPIKVEARLAESHLVSAPAMRLGAKHWAKVGPLLPSREDYWKSLARTTAFVATAKEESYGLEYVEALVAGVIGIFPDADWAHALVPERYPFFYRGVSEAEGLLLKAVQDPAACRAEIDQAVGQPFSDWLNAHHNDDNFETAIADAIEKWFGKVDNVNRPKR
ncbi:MAG: glycosyltransferase family 1 protein [Propionibacteriaceae bacterium]|jgi:hypothetical protein|nr:glycosyltransferase family 1 protein [Propionibacteriaceae bacterium]